MRDRSHDIGCKGDFVTGYDMHTFVKADSLGFIKSTHVPAPIDIDCLARDVTIARKHYDDVSNLFDSTKASNGNQVRPCGRIPCYHFSYDQGRSDSVYSDSFLR